MILSGWECSNDWNKDYRQGKCACRSLEDLVKVTVELDFEGMVDPDVDMTSLSGNHLADLIFYALDGDLGGFVLNSVVILKRED